MIFNCTISFVFKLIIPILLILSFSSCQNYAGKISTNDNYSILTNTSKNQRIKFTIKTTVEHENGKTTSHISFKELEPGEETILGKNINFLGDRFYSKQLFDTIKQYIHYNKEVRQTKYSIKTSKEIAKFQNEKYVYTKEHLTTYTKNNISYNPYQDNDGGINLFFSTSNWKKIDSIKKHQIQIITYLAPSELISDQTKPKKQEKIIYTYKITGGRVLN